MNTNIELTDGQLREVRAVEQALTTAQAERARLTPDGRSFYAPDEHQRREQAIEEALDATLARVSAAADEAVTSAAGTLDGLTDTDPLDTLSVPEQEAANRRAAFVREDAERLPLADLTRRVRQALAGSDRAMTYLWLRYGDARFQAEQASGHVAPGAVGDLRALSEAIKEAAARFVDQRALANAEDRLATARAFRARVWDTVRPLNVAREVAAMRRSGRYSGVL